MLSPALLPRKAADCLIMSECRRITFRLSRMQSQTSLMHHWLSFLGSGDECVICLFSYHANQCIYFGRRSQCSPLNVEYIRLNIIDALMTLILRMGQRAHHLLFQLQRQPIHLLWRDVTMKPLDCWMCKTKNRWRTVDTHIKHIEIAFVCSIFVCNWSHTHYWHPVLRFWILSFASWSVLASQFLINFYPRYLSERWGGPITLLRIRPAISGM